MEKLIREWDGEEIITRYDHPTGAWIFIAIHSTRLGPAAGGTRMKSYASVEDALKDAMRLSAGMTYKFAVPGMPFGGGKAVIAVPAKLDPALRAGLLRRYGRLIGQVGGLLNTGPDLGTTPADMDLIAEHGSPHVFGRTPAAGGAGASGPATALGVFNAIEVVCEELFGDTSVAGRRVLVQGTGSVGGSLIGLLTQAGARVMFSDVDEEKVRHFRDELGLAYIPPEQLFGASCDILSPCALGGILNADNIPRLKCEGIAGGANNQLDTPEDAERLRQRGILYAPDFVVNVGGAMHLIYAETLGWDDARIEQDIAMTVRRTLHQLFDVARNEGITTDAAAYRIAEARLATGPAADRPELAIGRN